jgi:hypothetical protein
MSENQGIWNLTTSRIERGCCHHSVGCSASRCTQKLKVLKFHKRNEAVLRVSGHPVMPSRPKACAPRLQWCIYSYGLSEETSGHCPASPETPNRARLSNILMLPWLGEYLRSLHIMSYELSSCSEKKTQTGTMFLCGFAPESSNDYANQCVPHSVP